MKIGIYALAKNESQLAGTRSPSPLANSQDKTGFQRFTRPPPWITFSHRPTQLHLWVESSAPCSQRQSHYLPSLPLPAKAASPSLSIFSLAPKGILPHPN